MAFERVKGQAQVKDILTRTLSRKRVPHALLFHGPEGAGKDAMAIEMAKALICQQDSDTYCDSCPDCQRIGQLNHPDVQFIYPATATASEKDHAEIKKSLVDNPYLRVKPWASPTISIDRIRTLKKTSTMTSFENKGRVIIIAEAHRMSIEATNSLLKILEEPPAKMTIILTCDQPMLLLPTIISRCQGIRFIPLSWDDIEQTLTNQYSIEQQRAHLIAKLSAGNLRRALELLEDALEEKRTRIIDMLRNVLKGDLDRLMMVEELVKRDDKKVIQEYLELMLLWFRDVMIIAEGGDRAMLVNLDQVETLERFHQSFETINYHKIVERIEQALERIRRHVYVNLIMINLFYFLKKQLRRKHG